MQSSGVLAVAAFARGRVQDFRFFFVVIDPKILIFRLFLAVLGEVVGAPAHACIDAGADLIMGHHAHVPKGIEIYKGKAIFYSLSNFCMTKPYAAAAWNEPAWAHGAIRGYTDLDPEYPLLPYGRDAKRTLMLKAMLSKDGVKRVSFLPMLIDKQYRPEVLRNGDERFDDMVAYMDWASDGFEHKFTVDGDEVVVTAA